MFSVVIFAEVRHRVFLSHLDYGRLEVHFVLLARVVTAVDLCIIHAVMLVESVASGFTSLQTIVVK